jgi:hypothetical protein
VVHTICEIGNSAIAQSFGADVNADAAHACGQRNPVLHGATFIDHVAPRHKEKHLLPHRAIRLALWSGREHLFFTLLVATAFARAGTSGALVLGDRCATRLNTLRDVDLPRAIASKAKAVHARSVLERVEEKVLSVLHRADQELGFGLAA